MSGRTFDEFLAAVKDSVDGQAKRKNYASNGLDGKNQLLEVGKLLNFEPQHGIGEIVYKCAEYLKDPREVLLIKIAGWAYILWKARAAEQAATENRLCRAGD